MLKAHARLTGAHESRPRRRRSPSSAPETLSAEGQHVPNPVSAEDAAECRRRNRETHLLSRNLETMQ